MELENLDFIAFKVVENFRKWANPTAAELSLAKMIATDMKAAIYKELNK
jgi:hypothetical protein